MVTTATTDRYSVSIFDLPLEIEASAGVLSNDDSTTGSTLSAILEDAPDNGIIQLNTDGSFTYTPDSDFLGVDSFTYTAVDGSGASDTAFVRIQVNFLPDAPADATRGTVNGDLLRGTSGADYILGLGGNDTIIGRAGDDTINGGNGRDLILGRNGDELIDGGAGRDTINGGLGQDGIFGNNGDDLLRGQRGGDLLLGGAGRDVLQGGAGDDSLAGGDGSDTIRGGSGTDNFIVEIAPGVDTFSDFVLGEDLIALSDGLVFGDVSFDEVGNVTNILLNNEVLARVTVIGDGTLGVASNFVLF